MFFDCYEDPAELFIVEGRHAANAINQVRNRRSQAVFAIQGKVPNTSSLTGQKKALRNQHLQALMAILEPDGVQQRFTRVTLLCDADPDGLHARLLLARFFQLCLPQLVERNMVVHVYPPLYQMHDAISGKVAFGWRRNSPGNSGNHATTLTYFKGIASMSADALTETCVNAVTRREFVLQMTDNAVDSPSPFNS